MAVRPMLDLTATGAYSNFCGQASPFGALAASWSVVYVVAFGRNYYLEGGGGPSQYDDDFDEFMAGAPRWLELNDFWLLILHFPRDIIDDVITFDPLLPPGRVLPQIGGRVSVAQISHWGDHGPFPRSGEPYRPVYDLSAINSAYQPIADAAGVIDGYAVISESWLSNWRNPSPSQDGLGGPTANEALTAFRASRFEFFGPPPSARTPLMNFLLGATPDNQFGSRRWLSGVNYIIQHAGQPYSY